MRERAAERQSHPSRPPRRPFRCSDTKNPPTVDHGDYRTDTMPVRPHVGGQDRLLAGVDCQTTQTGPALVDVSLPSGSQPHPAPPPRPKNRDLPPRYHQAPVGPLKSGAYPWERWLAETRRYAVSVPAFLVPDADVCWSSRAWAEDVSCPIIWPRPAGTSTELARPRCLSGPDALMIPGGHPFRATIPAPDPATGRWRTGGGCTPITTTGCWVNGYTVISTSACGTSGSIPTGAHRCGFSVFHYWLQLSCFASDGSARPPHPDPSSAR